ncbi:carboxypeptidase-like regulatory domain-containing protein [uncultured Draconibacterium sp.]|uniref:carboxypeptidase-like regulatory domain-containing protein n=1 Tax=uncultured Draconibacterium sp. TaxID=1573823 RepID=UPI00321710F7
METFLLYIGKAALAAGAFYVVYLALFQHQKHFVFNRIYLPVSLAVSFIIPLITFTSTNYITANQSIGTNSFAFLPEAIENTQTEFTYQWYHYLFGIYIVGTIGFLFHLLMGHIKAFAIIRFSRLQEIFGAQVNLTLKDVHPFSFFNKIVLSEKTLDNPNLEMIVNHEMIHVKEKHTHDILFAELLFLLQWFNPFAWLIKDAIRNNLEYKTDHQITKNNNAEAYQLAMVGLVHKKGVAPFLTALNGSQLKNRIIMMKKKTENKYALLKQLFVLPLLALLVMSLSNKEVNTKIINNTDQLKVVVDGVELPSNHPGLTTLDFSKGFNGGDLVKALGIEDKVVSNTLSFDKNPQEDGIYYIRTKDYVPGTNPEFETITEVTPSTEVIVKGKVTNEKGTPIPAAAVIVEGTNMGTISDMSGNYEIKTDENSTLVFSMIGYAKKEVPVKNKTEINVELSKDVSLDDGKSMIYVPAKGESDEVPSVQRKINFDTGEIVEVSSTKGYKHYVTGKITDKDGNSIPDVSVFILNKSIGTVTDANGDYKLGLNNPDVTLATWVKGFKDQEIKVDGKEVVNFKLARDEEINVIGYGKQKDAPTVDKLALKLNGDEANPPLYVVDGKISKSIEYLAPDAIESISVLKDESATSLYGEKGKNGVIVITTKEAAKEKMRNAIVILDGKKYEGDVSDIDPETIEKMEVLKNESATKLYGPEAKDGAIIITSKNKLNFGDKSPLIFIDGVKSTKDMNDIDPDQIQSINVIKDASAIETYGNEGKNGVILISTKTEKITSSLEMRKFIAQRIKYPKEAQQANKGGIAKLFVKVNSDGIVYSVSDKKVKDAVSIEEVVVVGYAPKPEEIVSGKTEDFTAAFNNQVKAVINQFPKLQISEYKGKTLEFTVKFMLQ